MSIWERFVKGEMVHVIIHPKGVVRMRTLDMFLNNMDILTPAEYLELATKHPERIKDAHMILPRIGKDNHFGKFQVVYNVGVYEVAP